MGCHDRSLDESRKELASQARSGEMTLLPVESWFVYPRERWREDMEIIIAGVKARTKPGGQETD